MSTRTNYSEKEERFRLDNKYIKPQLAVYALELSGLLEYSVREQISRVESRNLEGVKNSPDYREMVALAGTVSRLDTRSYLQDLLKMTPEELEDHIYFIMDILRSTGVPFQSVFLNYKKTIPDLIQGFVENPDLSGILNYAYRYGDPHVRSKVEEFLDDRSAIRFDLDSGEGKTEMDGGKLLYRLSSTLPVEKDDQKYLKGAIILAHEMYHTGNKAYELEEEVNAFKASMQMVENLQRVLNVELTDPNIKAQYELYNMMDEQNYQIILNNMQKNFPLFGNDQEKRQYYNEQFFFISYFISKDDYEALLRKYITSHPWAWAKYNIGLLAGLVSGIVMGAVNTVAALWDLIVLIVNLYIEYLKLLGKVIPKIPGTIWDTITWLFSEIKQHVTDFDTAIKEDLEMLKDAKALAKALVDLIINLPGAIGQLIVAVKDYLFKYICDSLTTWSKKNPEKQGFDVGYMTGIIIFEIVIAIIGTKGIDKLAKAAKTGKLASLLTKLKLDKFIKAIDKLKELAEKLRLLIKAKQLEKLKNFKLILKQFNDKEKIIFLRNLTDDGVNGLKRFADNDFIANLAKNSGKGDDVSKIVNNLNKYMDEITDSYGKHVNVRDIAEPRTSTSPINGCHNQFEFLRQPDLVKDNHFPSNVAQQDGIIKYEYKVYQLKPGSSGLSPASIDYTKMKSKSGFKTVYNPRIWPQQKLEKAVIEAYLDALSNNQINGRRWRGLTKSGLPVEGWIDTTGKIKTFYFNF